MSNNSVNVKLLRRIKKHILEEPKRFDMQFIRHPLIGIQKAKIPACGTVCCIAGWAIKLTYPASTPNGMFWENAIKEPVGLRLAENLICGRDVDRLFFTNQWPEALEIPYSRAKTPLQKAKAGAAAIDSYIKANGDWSAIGL